MPLRPETFCLSLARPARELVPGGQVVCLVTTEARFTEEVQANLKFSMTRHGEDGQREKVVLLQDLCSISSDLAQFKFGFLLGGAGGYRVMVRLGEAHVTDSPLRFEVAEPETGSCSEDGEDEMFSSMVEELKLAEVEEELKGEDELKLEEVESPVAEKEVEEAVKNSTEQELAMLVAEMDVVRELGLPLTLALVEAQVARLEGLQEGQGLAGRKQASQPPPLPEAEREVSRPGQAREGNTARPATTAALPGALDLSTCPATLEASAVLSIPSSRLEGRNPDCSLAGPIGLCLLATGTIVVASTFDDKVKMFDGEGRFVRAVEGGGAFRRPSDMVALRVGGFVVRDDQSLRLFGESGEFVASLGEDRAATRCYGLAEDHQGHLVSLQVQRSGTKGPELAFTNISTRKMVRRVELEEVVGDTARSRCRFLAFQGGNLYITDLGHHMVYVMDATTYTVTQKFGGPGDGPGCFADPAGLVVDGQGNMLVADSRNHRLCLFSPTGRFLGAPRLAEVRRPSGLALCPATRALYVLNLAGSKALVKYQLKC